jgi:hypothetical protein
MTDVVTDNLKLTLMENGTHNNTWNDVYSANYQRIEAKLTGVTEIETTGGNTALTDDEEFAAIISVTGTLAADANILMSGRQGMWLVRHDADGDFNVIFKLTGQDGVTLAPGDAKTIFCDGTDP